MRSLIDSQKKQIQKEIRKTNNILSDKIVVFKNTKTVQNFSLPKLSL